MQKNGAGLHTASSCFWDSSTDGTGSSRREGLSGHLPAGPAARGPRWGLGSQSSALGRVCERSRVFECVLTGVTFKNLFWERGCPAGLVGRTEVSARVLGLPGWAPEGPQPPFPAGSCTVRWENKTMYCIVSAFGLSIWPPRPARASPASQHCSSSSHHQPSSPCPPFSSWVCQCRETHQITALFCEPPTPGQRSHAPRSSGAVLPLVLTLNVSFQRC